MLMLDIDHAIGVLGALRKLGVNVDVDDFGTGYSSLTYLQRLPIDTLKIDKSFIDRLAEGDDSIVSAVVALGQSLGVDVLAEGVESADQAERLVTLGCDYAQGYYFARPLASVDAFLSLIERQTLPMPAHQIAAAR
jgi:EAL domain-containing protein (putative c-di-GMP-specific phosphodiesterase class I)